MNAKQQLRADFLYEQQLTNLKLQGKRPATIDAYSRVMRRITGHFDKAPDTPSWSTVRVERNGLVNHLRDESLIVVMLGGGYTVACTWLRFSLRIVMFGWISRIHRA